MFFEFIGFNQIPIGPLGLILLLNNNFQYIKQKKMLKILPECVKTCEISSFQRQFNSFNAPAMIFQEKKRIDWFPCGLNSPL